MNKIVISGFYGFHNIGDEAILETLTEQLRKLDPDMQITVLSHSPEETMQKFGVQAIKRNDPFKVIRAIFKSDILLSGGGSLLQDDTSARSIHYYLTILRIGLFFKKKVFLISNGIGPIIRDGNKKIVAKVLNRVEHITVRDFNSKKLLVDIGVKTEKVSVSADMVVAMRMEDKQFGAEILANLKMIAPERKIIAIAIRQKDFRDAEKRLSLVTLANRLSETYSVVFVPFYYKNDTKIYDDIHMDVSEHVYFIKEKYNSDEFMSLLQNFDLLIGSRLHSLIFALVAEIPFIGISYDPKIENFMEMIDMKPVCAMSNFDADVILEEVNRIYEDYEGQKHKIVLAKQSLKSRLLINDEMLMKVL